MSDLSAQVRKALDAAVAAIGGAPREGQIADLNASLHSNQ